MEQIPWAITQLQCLCHMSEQMSFINMLFDRTLGSKRIIAAAMPVKFSRDCSWQVCCSFPPTPPEKQPSGQGHHLLAWTRGPRAEHSVHVCAQTHWTLRVMSQWRQKKNWERGAPVRYLLQEIRKNWGKSDYTIYKRGSVCTLTRQEQRSWIKARRAARKIDAVWVQEAVWEEYWEAWVLQQDFWLTVPVFLLLLGDHTIDVNDRAGPIHVILPLSANRCEQN